MKLNFMVSIGVLGTVAALNMAPASAQTAQSDAASAQPSSASRASMAEEHMTWELDAARWSAEHRAAATRLNAIARHLRDGRNHLKAY